MYLGQILEFLGEQEDNEHWWKVKDEDGHIGCVPASYVIKKEQQVQLTSPIYILFKLCR